MIFPSTYQSPNTVNKNAMEFVIGTVKLNSASSSSALSSELSLQAYMSRQQQEREGGAGEEHTSLTNQQKEPNTSRKIDNQRHSISPISQNIHQTKYRPYDFLFYRCVIPIISAFEATRAFSEAVKTIEGRVRKWFMLARGASYEWCGESPC